MGLFGKKKSNPPKSSGSTYSNTTSPSGNGQSALDRELDKTFDLVSSLSRKEILDKCLDTLTVLIKRLNSDQFGALSVFMYACVAADGKLTREEYVFTEPVLKMMLNDQNLTYEKASGFIASLGVGQSADLQSKAINVAKGLLGRLDSDTGTLMLLAGVYLCACDGHISYDEKAFIRKVIS